MAKARSLLAATLLFGITAQPALAQLNTALSPAEVSQILYQRCDRERGLAQRVVSPDDWNHIMARSNQVLVANVDTARLNAMLDDTSKGSSRVEQALGELQYCLIMNKISVAENHERRAKR